MPPAPPVGDGFGPASDNSKVFAAIGYVIWPVALVALLMEPYKNEKWLRSHAVQALALNLVVWVLSVLTMPLYGLGGIVGIAGFVYAIVLAIKAYNGESLQIPVIHGLVKNYL